MSNLNLNWAKVEELIATGHINSHRHPEAPYRILNYSAQTQYSWNWTPETMACRGLIVADDNKVIARAFPKFFSIEQRTEPLPVEPFKVFEKLDGSLGILYHHNGQSHIATRGSFVSDQAQWATEWLHKYHPDAVFAEGQTYLFEIIYRQNRIVVDYGDFEGLILLAVIDNETGADIAPPDIGIPIVKRYDGIRDVSEIAGLEEPNKEGLVLLFESGLRVKAKFAEYKRLHRILTSLTARHIWEAMQIPNGLVPILERVPDEFYSWVRNTEREMKTHYASIEAQCRGDFDARPDGDRKALAGYFTRCQHPAILFKMLDGRDHSDLIWKRIYPEHSKAFRDDREG